MNHNTLSPHWHQHTFQAMGCQMAVWVEMVDNYWANSLLHQAENMFHDAERCMSRFDHQSELTYLNSNPKKWVHISPHLWEVIVCALQLAMETDGLFDPTLLDAVEAAGYTHSFSSNNISVTSTAFHLTSVARWREIELNSKKRAVRLPANVRLDLGGIGKGYTAQLVVSSLSDKCPCLVDAGGDITAGDAPIGWEGWPIGLATPIGAFKGHEDVFRMWLKNASLATSGIDYRQWKTQNGTTMHHIIDPRTGLPAKTDVLTVSVLADNPIKAEAWATAMLVAGVAEGYETLSQQSLAGVFIDQQYQLFLTPAMQAIETFI